ncbi:hypothetical protein REPUB_Repub19eG0042300 [Reevesia pubescens]
MDDVSDHFRAVQNFHHALESSGLTDSWLSICLERKRDLLVLFPNYPPYLRRLLHHVVLSFRDVRKVSGPPKKSFRQECCLNIMIAPKAPMDQRLRLSPEFLDSRSLQLN